MFSAALLTEYVAAFAPTRSIEPMLPAVLDRYRIALRRPFSRKGRHTCERSAGPATFVRTVRRSSSGSIVNAVSVAICEAGTIQRWNDGNEHCPEMGSCALTMPALLTR